MIFTTKVTVGLEKFHQYVVCLYFIRETFAEIITFTFQSLAQPDLIELFGVVQKMLAMS